MKIFACHLLNDYSGSPKVLMQLINGWIKNDIEVIVLTNKDNNGFLSNLKGVKYNLYWYKWSKNNFVRLLNYTISQFLLFFKILYLAHKNDIVYVNTVLPFGASLAAKVKKAKIIYHVHEVSVNPKILKWFLFKIPVLLADKIIYVSKYVRNANRRNKTKNGIVIYNSIDNDFLLHANNYKKQNPDYKNVLMICSLKVYKGIFEFIDLARVNKHFNFKLVVNARNSEVDDFLKSIDVPKNLTIFASQSNTHPFYQWADVVLNLSHPDKWVETFGMTIVEAMAYGLPVIVPPVGGITELVKDYENGFLVDARNSKLLSNTLNMILSDKELYHKLSSTSTEKIKNYSEISFINKSLVSLN